MTLTTQAINKYISTIERSLAERYGNVDDSWRLLLDMLADNLRLYKVIQDKIQTKPSELKNVDIKNFKEISATILKITQKLSVASPYDLSKTKLPQKEEKENDYVESLIG